MASDVPEYKPAVLDAYPIKLGDPQSAAMKLLEAANKYENAAPKNPEKPDADPTLHPESVIKTSEFVERAILAGDLRALKLAQDNVDPATLSEAINFTNQVLSHVKPELKQPFYLYFSPVTADASKDGSIELMYSPVPNHPDTDMSYMVPHTDKAFATEPHGAHPLASRVATEVALALVSEVHETPEAIFSGPPKKPEY